jgi:class 3 adenylate cyclase/tetratricopeptide (TPR) repeat protein
MMRVERSGMSTFTDDQHDTGLRRRRAVVLHADVVGYSRLLADDPAATVAHMRACQRLVERAVDDVGGLLINFVGDAFAAVFDDARAGMRAAIAIAGAVRRRNVGVPDHRRVSFRMGLDAGDVVVTDDGTHFGDPINVAARVQSLAEPGGVNVTEAVYAELDEPALRLLPLGPRRLKHIPGEVRVYRLADMATSDASVARAARRGAEPTIAVLPFDGGDDDATRTVARALRFDLIDGLGAIPGLRVLELEPSAAGGRPGENIAHDRSAEYALTCRVVAGDAGLRVYGQVSDTRTVNRVWGRRWDGSADALFALQDEVTADVARAVEVELVVGEPARIYQATLDGAALEVVYRGLHQMMAGPADWRASVDAFRSLPAAHPGEIVGAALGAFSLWWGVVHGLSDRPDEDLAHAARLSARGVELGDDTGLSQMVSAALRLHGGGDPQLALTDARRAVALRPTCDVSFAVEGSVLRYLGDWRAAVDACERALALSATPRPWFLTVMASAYYVGRRYRDAADTAERALDLRPDDLEALMVLAASQQALGLHRRARAAVATLVEHHPGIRRDGLWRHHPYRDPAVIERWTAHLTDADMP